MAVAALMREQQAQPQLSPANSSCLTVEPTAIHPAVVMAEPLQSKTCTFDWGNITPGTAEVTVTRWKIMVMLCQGTASTSLAADQQM
jgi:hypothetical protein